MAENGPPNPEPLIPADLRARLEDLKEVLARNGTVLHRREPDRKPSWRLRFRMPSPDGQGRKHCSIPLSDPQVAMAVKRLIDTWREQRFEQRRSARQAEQARRQAERRKKEHYRYRRSLVEIVAGGSRRHRQRIGRLYTDAAQQDPWAEVEFIFHNRHLQPPKRRGRPRKGGLVLPKSLSGHSSDSPIAFFSRNCPSFIDAVRRQAEAWRRYLEE